MEAPTFMKIPHITKLKLIPPQRQKSKGEMINAKSFGGKAPRSPDIQKQSLIFFISIEIH